MRITPILALLLGLSVGACGSRQPAAVETPAPVEVPSDVRDAITEAVEHYRQAHEEHSPESLASIYTRGLDVTVVAQGRSYRGWTQVEAYLHRRIGAATKVRVAIRELSVVELGSDVALAHARLESTIGDDVTTVTERGVVTLMFRKVEERWKVVAEHFSYPGR